MRKVDEEDPDEADFQLVKSRFLQLEDAAREREERDHKYLPVRSNQLYAPKIEADQILSYYVFDARQHAVNYYFEKSNESDWRVSELTPMAIDDGHLGKTIANLFAALHRLRADREGDCHHLHNYHRALQAFQALLSEETTSWLSILSCVVLFAQYDVNTQKGRNLAMHLNAAGKLILANAGLPLPASLQSRKRTLIRITMVFDLQHGLVSGDRLYLPMHLYEANMIESSTSREWSRTPHSIDRLWSTTHLLSARFTHFTTSEPTTHELLSLYRELSQTIVERQGDHFTVDDKSPLHSYCPFGPTVLFRSPSLRLIAVMLHSLVLLMGSWFPEVVPKGDVLKSRNMIMCLHAPLFDVDLKGKRGKDEGRFLHQAFPAIVQIMIAASEVGEEEVLGQQWITIAMEVARKQGYSLGEFMLMIIKSHAEPNMPWKKMGSRAFVEVCRRLRKAGVA